MVRAAPTPAGIILYSPFSCSLSAFSVAVAVATEGGGASRLLPLLLASVEREPPGSAASEGGGAGDPSTGSFARFPGTGRRRGCAIGSWEDRSPRDCLQRFQRELGGGGCSVEENGWKRVLAGGMTRKCSHCSHNGHNSRTCPNRGVKLFGVRLTDGSIRKSASMGNLSHYAGSSSGGGGASPAADGHDGGDGAAAEGYASEDFVQGSSSSCRERKKGVPWTEDEHRMFLLGLQKLGKGDWRGIARNFVVSRTPTQVASHAQKYFIRQSNSSRRKRRSSLFDMIPDESIDMPPLFAPNSQESETKADSPLPAPPALDEEFEAMDSTNSNDSVAPNPDNSQCYPVMFPAYFSPFFPFPFPYWPGYGGETVEKETHEIVKPTAIHSKTPINVEELVGMSKLSLKDSHGETTSSSLSLKLAGGSDRQSAFHASSSTSSSNVNSSTNAIHAV